MGRWRNTRDNNALANQKKKRFSKQIKATTL